MFSRNMAAPQQIEQVRLPLVCTCFPVRSTVKRNVIPLQGQQLNHCTNQEFLDFSRASAINGSVRLATSS